VQLVGSCTAACDSIVYMVEKYAKMISDASDILLMRASLFVSFSIVCLTSLSVSGCSIDSFHVYYAPNGNKNKDGYFTPEHVTTHMNLVVKARPDDLYALDGTSMLGCVDSRADEATFGTPGGDLAELAMGLYVYHNLTNRAPDYASVKMIFRAFLQQHVSTSRPFYYHTDDSKVRKLFAEVGAKLGRNITSFPVHSPSTNDLNVWLGEVAQSYAQGCGHLRLMIESPAKYGMGSARILQDLIRAFYEEMWATRTAVERAKFMFKTRLGSLEGKAIAIIKNARGECLGYSPGIMPYISGSSVFIYTPSMVDAFRTKVMSPFFASLAGPGWNAALFDSEIAALFGVQLGATLANLGAAKDSSLINVDITTSGQPSKPSCQSDSPGIFDQRNIITSGVGAVIGAAATLAIVLAIIFRRRMFGCCGALLEEKPSLKSALLQAETSAAHCHSELQPTSNLQSEEHV
jgi:hypothetical protein